MTEVVRVADVSGKLAFSIDQTTAGDQVELVFRGTADVKAHERLKAYVAAIHDELVRRGVKKVVVDFVTLEFMNSSCMATLVTWIGLDEALDFEHQYKLVFRPNPKAHWQQRSLSSLARFAARLVSVEAAA